MLQNFVFWSQCPIPGFNIGRSFFVKVIPERTNAFEALNAEVIEGSLIFTNVKMIKPEYWDVACEFFFMGHIIECEFM